MYKIRYINDEEINAMLGGSILPEHYGSRIYTIFHNDKICVAKWQKISDEISLEDIFREADLQNLAAQNGISIPVQELFICDKGVFMIMDLLDSTLDKKLLYLNEEQKEYIKCYKDKILERLYKHKKYIGTEDYYRKNLLEADAHTSINIILSLKEINRDFIIPEDSAEVKEGILKALKDCFSLIEKLKLPGIRHNDPHDQNFMVDNNGRWYLIDFGMAEFLEEYSNCHFRADVNLFSTFILDIVYPNRGYISDFMSKIDT